MMVKNFLLRFFMIGALVSAVVASCVACHPQVNSKYWFNTTDQDAIYGQHIQRQAVRVKKLLGGIAVFSNGQVRAGNMTGYGTGSVVAVNGGSSLVLTAAHVCENDDIVDIEGGRFFVKDVSLSIMTAEGEEFNASIYSVDSILDMCILDVSGIAGDVAVIADEAPPSAAFLTYAGAPNATWEKQMIPIFDCRYAGRVQKTRGIVRKDMMLMTCAAVPGASGSAVYYKGKIIGMFTVISTVFHHEAYLVPQEQLKVFVDAARLKWLPQVESPQIMIDLDDPNWPLGN